MPTTETAPALPETEADVRRMLTIHRIASVQPQCPDVARHRLTRFLQDYDDAVIIMRQDAPTAYATAWRAMRAREQRQQERSA